MAFVELYIEDELIDLDDAAIQTDYAIAEIGNFATRNSFRSVDFDIPKTANNKRILDNSDIVNNLTTRPYRRLKARLAVDGIDQLIRFADIEQASDTYNIRMYGGNASFFDLIKNLNLSDLDLSEFDHFRTLTNVINSRINTDGYIYPLVDYQSDNLNIIIDNASNIYRINYIFPSLFLETILNKAVSELGYTVTNNLLLSPDYLKGKLILPCVTPVRNLDGSRYLLNVESDTNRNYNGVDQVIVFDNLVSGTTYFTSGDSTLWLSIVTFQDEVNVKGNLRIFIANSSLPPPQNVVVKARVSRPSPLLFEDIILDTISVTPTPTIFNIPFDLTVLEDNERVEFEFMLDIPTAQVTIFGSNTFYEITECEILKPLDITPFLNYVTVNSLFGKLKVSDVFKAYLQKFCALIQVNEFTKVVQLDYFDTVGKNIGIAIDWSEKIDYSETESIEFELNKYAQTNNFSYKDDNDVDKPIGTDGSINVDDETLDADADIVGLIYSATEMVIRLQGLQLPNIGLFETTDGSPPTTDLKGKANPRILLLERVAGDVDYTDGVGTTTVTTNLPLAWFIRLDKDYNLGFTNNLIPLFYGTLQNVLNRAKIVTENVRLTPLDIQQLDFLKPVFIDKHNSYFYISKISGFNPATTEATEVELIKLR